MSYAILMDVSGDLDMSVESNKVVEFLSMEYSLGDDMLTCTTPPSRDELKKFYDGQRNGDLTKTSQITPFMYEEYVKPYFEKGMDVICLCLSSGLSSTFQSALTAKANLEDEYPDRKFCPVDSLAATGGMGVLIERAIRNKEAGMTVEENATDIDAAAHKIKHWFLVQDLMYLKRGGRVSAATAVLGSALNINPILQILPDGTLANIDKQRGNKKAAKKVLELFAENYDPEAGDVIYVIDADTIEIGDLLEAEIKKLYPAAVIRRSGLSPIIGAHTGPGMAAICHMGKN